MKKYAFNCWKTLKTIKLQRSILNGASVNVAKAEKINCMRARLNPLLFFNGQSAAKSERKGSTVIPWQHRLQQKYGSSEWVKSP